MMYSVMEFRLFPFILVPVLSRMTRDCWDRYPEEWAYFRDVYSRVYNTNTGLEDLMNCMEWKYNTLDNKGAVCYGRRQGDVCPLCTDYRECLEGRPDLCEKNETNPLTLYERCWRICQDINTRIGRHEMSVTEAFNASTDPVLMAKQQIRNHVCSPDYLFVVCSETKGRGIHTRVDIPEDSYVLYYNGKWCSIYPEGDATYTFEMLVKPNSRWIDARYEDESYGRLMNDNKYHGNLYVELLHIDDEWYVTFFASRDIEAGEELTYDYGGKDSGYWWRVQETEEEEEVEEAGEVEEEEEEGGEGGEGEGEDKNIITDYKEDNWGDDHDNNCLTQDNIEFEFEENGWNAEITKTPLQQEL